MLRRVHQQRLKLRRDALRKTSSGDETAAWLRERGITHVLINYSEWFRLDRSYALALSDDERRWELVQWDDSTRLQAQRKMLGTLLNARQFEKYGAAWPDGIYPAYFKLSPLEYQRMEEFFQRRTRVIPPWTGEVLELREIF